MPTGFKNVVIMGDHGGGQPATYAEVAKKMDAKYAPEGKHVFFCDEVYAKAQGDFDDWLARTAIRAARTPAFPTRRRCCISAATRAGCARS